MMRPVRHIITAMAVLFFLNSVQVSAETKLIFDTPTTSEDKAAKQLVENVAKETVKLVNDYAPLPDTLTIRFGNLDGPLFDPETTTIQMPYEFVRYAKEKFQSVPPSHEGITPDEATKASILHTLLHEYGHAYLFLWDFPALGKEEDAVDSFATLSIIRFYDAETAFIGVDLFAIEDMGTEFIDDVSMWGEHSLDAQRYARSLCLIYGSDPEKFEDLMDPELVEAERDLFCPYEFETQSRNWSRVIEMLSESE
ncbi:DUF4344 domain-containing metallopeptidase [Grimontia sp. AD028]|uniref:DUF4344 domain-containing metallopeptidase n=1 Tax=Grimontia sp. AD028 TaxID=1581149 RepID=UPI0009E3095D|nr:DUF4344 domain-containing metallopeptidase [Grimontia sp. AD028]